jgi:beta-barrel assembly-enhancing protease
MKNIWVVGMFWLGLQGLLVPLAQAMPGVLIRDEVLRQTPQAAAPVLAQIKRGAAVEVEQRTHGWLLISSGSMRGWVRILSVRGGEETHNGVNNALGVGLDKFKSVFAPSKGIGNRVVAVAGLRGMDEAQQYVEQGEVALAQLDRHLASADQVAEFVQAGGLAARALPYLDPPSKAESGLVRWLKRRGDDTPVTIKLNKATLHTALLMGQPSQNDELRIGTHLAGQMMQKAPLVNNDAVQRYINLVGRAVANQGEQQNLVWRFAVLDSPELFSISAPGGFVFITRALYQTLDSEAALAALLGSEIAQVLRKQSLAYLKSKAQTLSRSPIAEENAESHYLADLLGDASEYMSRTLVAEDVYAADRSGLVLAARAGYEPFALALVLQSLGQIPSSAPEIALYQQSRPSLTARLSHLAEAIEAHETGSALDALAGQSLAERFAQYSLPTNLD